MHSCYNVYIYIFISGYCKFVYLSSEKKKRCGRYIYKVGSNYIDAVIVRYIGGWDIRLESNVSYIFGTVSFPKAM
jgi:hypothetical protein